MTYSNGQDGHFVYSIETTPGTRETPALALPFRNERLGDTGSQPMFRQGIIKGRGMNHGHDRTKSDIGGTVELDLVAESIGSLLKAAFGAVSTTGAGPYEHVFTPGDIADDSMSVQVGWDDSAGTAFRKDYIGCLVEGFGLDVQADQHPDFSVDLKALSEENDAYAAVVPSFASFTYFEFADLTVAFDAGSTVCLDSLQLRYQNNLFQSPSICPTNPRARVYEPSGRPSGSGTIVRDFEDWTYYDKFVAGTEATIQAILTAGASAILQFDLRVVFTGETPNVPGMERIKQRIPFELTSGTSDADAITCTLTSTDATV